MDSNSGHTNVRNFSSCGYSFLAGKNSYNFNVSDISDSSFVRRIVETMPIVIDWAIGNQNYNQMNRSDIICQPNSVCGYSASTLGGYRCNCSPGYQGNPHLSPGYHGKYLFKRNGGLLLQQQMSAHDHVLENMGNFTSKELENAIERFNESRVLGRGGQGTIYKGMLSDGRIVVVKKSKQVNQIQLKDFINEVVVLSQVNHRNVVKLLGCCLETEVPLLVYEFIPNQTLYHLIHDHDADIPFSWDITLRIAIEIANTIGYLHSALSVPIYHRDMKSTNILLDEQFRTKLSDFGISPSGAVDRHT